MQLTHIKGATHTDSRGKLEYINDIDLTQVKRFYKITPADTSIIRAWQVHKIEVKWFHCITGSFEVKIINLGTKEVSNYTLKAENMTVLYIPKNNANGFRALEENSTLQVFSDKTLEESLKDGANFDLNHFGDIW